jgi:hypothetical protein
MGTHDDKTARQQTRKNVNPLHKNKNLQQLFLFVHDAVDLNCMYGFWHNPSYGMIMGTHHNKTTQQQARTKP